MNIDISVDSYGFQKMVTRFKRVVFRVNNSPFLLNATIRHHMDKYALQNKVLSDKMISDLYVDDLTSGSNSLNELALKLSCTKRNILRISAMLFDPLGPSWTLLDPLGLISPIVLQTKFFFKQLCNLKVDWGRSCA